MPWDNPTGYTFNRTSIVLYAPQDSGVYALRGKTAWVYVGEAENICAQLLEHLSGDNMCIEQYSQFSGLTFSYELLPSSIRALRRDELVREFRPTCNR